MKTQWNDEVMALGKCCACEDPLKNSKHLNLVTLDKAANWEFPTWGNVSAKREEDRKGVRAVAIICDDCVEHKTVIKFAIDIKVVGNDPQESEAITETVIRYHDVMTLKDMPPITEKDLRKE
jgi:hypothetical protein